MKECWEGLVAWNNAVIFREILTFNPFKSEVSVKYIDSSQLFVFIIKIARSIINRGLSE